MMGQVEAFFGNENELRTALSYMGMERPEQMLEFVKLVVVTQGARGCLLLHARGKSSHSIGEGETGGGHHRCGRRLPGRLLRGTVPRFGPKGVRGHGRGDLLLCGRGEGGLDEHTGLATGPGTGRALSAVIFK